MAKFWVDSQEPGFDDVDVWKAFINPDATASRSFLGVTEAAEDYHVDPEDVCLVPELVQDDETGWVILAEPAD
jgi:hypothetical protein